MLAALKSGCQKDAEFWAAVAELRQSTSELGLLVLGRSAASDEEDATAPSDIEESRPSGPARWGAPATSTLTPTGPGEVGWTEAAPEGPKKAKKPKASVASAASSDTEGPKKVKKPKKKMADMTEEEKAAEKAKKEKRPPAPGVTAWNLLVTKTVSDMRQSGWESWTDAKGMLWPASKVATVKGAEQYVYDGGDHDGKPPSPALGGMLRASYLKSKGAPQVALQGEWAEME